MAKKKTNKERVTRAANSLKALHLSVVTNVDRERIGNIWDGLRALDDEQANTKYVLEDLCDEWESELPDDEVRSEMPKRMIAELRKKLHLQSSIVTVPMDGIQDLALLDGFLRKR